MKVGFGENMILIINELFTQKLKVYIKYHSDIKSDIEAT